MKRESVGHTDGRALWASPVSRVRVKVLLSQRDGKRTEYCTTTETIARYRKTGVECFETGTERGGAGRAEEERGRRGKSGNNGRTKSSGPCER